MSERSGRSARLAAWLALAPFAAAGAQYALTKSMHQDVAYYVNAVERWLGGARLYRDRDARSPRAGALTGLR